MKINARLMCFTKSYLLCLGLKQLLDAMASMQYGGGLSTGESGYIYVISEEGDSDFRKKYRKIGASGNVKARLQELQVGNARTLVVSYETRLRANVLAAERAAHDRLEHCLVRGEWYECTLYIAKKAITGA